MIKAPTIFWHYLTNIGKRTAFKENFGNCTLLFIEVPTKNGATINEGASKILVILKNATTENVLVLHEIKEYLLERKHTLTVGQLFIWFMI
jgi:hypothetical protein